MKSLLRQHLKKTSVIVGVLLVSSLVLGGCGGGKGEPTTTQPTQTSTTPAGGVMDFPSGKYTNTRLLANDNFRISWTNTDDTISIGIKGKTTGWLALALSPTLSKSRADLIIGAVSGGQLTLLDSFDPGYSGGHRQDTAVGGTNDLFDISGNETSGVTTIEFKRRLNTGDVNDLQLVNGDNPFLFAMGPDDTMASEHSLVGSGEITITLTHP
jgi:hypothetical protein